jgi:hypothetical protein
MGAVEVLYSKPLSDISGKVVYFVGDAVRDVVEEDREWVISVSRGGLVQ